MKIILLFIITLFSINICFAKTPDLKEFCSNCSDNPSYKEFRQIVEGKAVISDIDKQLLVDNELSSELGSPFIYTDLDNCINIALNKNFDIQIRNAYKDESFWLNKNAQFSILPDIYYNYDIKNLEGRYLVGGIVSTTTHEVPVQSLAVVEWSLFNQGKYFFLVAQAQNSLKSAKAEYEFTKDTIVRDTVLAYYDVLEKKMEMHVQKTNLYDRYEQLRYTQARFESGLGNLYDVKRAQAELAGAQQDYTTTLNTMRLKQAVLANVMGVDVLDAIYPFEITVDERVLVNPELGINELYAHAIKSREDVKSKIAEINAYRAQRSSNYTDLIPEVTFSYQNGFVGTKDRGLNAHNSLTMDIRAHLGKNMLLGTVTKVKADSALVKAKKLELVSLKRNIKENIINYYYDSENALKKIQASKYEVNAADLSLDLAMTSMQAGESTFIDVINSQNLKIKANINLIKNMIEYNRAQTNLLFETGLITSQTALKDYKKKFY